MAENQSMQVVRLHRLDGESKTKAFADVSIGEFVIKGLKVVDGKNGLFLSMPREKSKDGKWYDTVFPVTQEARKCLTDLVLEAYQQ
ncbi:MAG: SpoVG family protein [Candidatus Omnitrophota bacterium]